MSNVDRNDSNAAELEEVRVGGKAYRAAPMIGAEPGDCCQGCAGEGSALCAALPDCTRPSIIWVAAE